MLEVSNSLASPAAELPFEPIERRRAPKEQRNGHRTIGKRKRRRALWLSAAVLVLAAGAYAGERYFIPAQAAAFRVEKKPIAWNLKGPGLLEARNRVVLTARINGRLKWIGVDRNDPVKSGQVLARLEDEDLASSLASARADSDAAARAVNQAQSNLVRAEAGLEKFRLEADRRRKLIATGAVSRADFDTTEFALKQAEAEREGARIAVARATAQARAAQANVATAQARFEDATLRSPLDGLVVTRERNVGDIVISGTSVLQLVDPASLFISARFDESALGTLVLGQSAAITFNSVPNQAFTGKVLRIGHNVDQETREFLVDLTLESLPQNWALGQRAGVQIEVASGSDAILVPMRFIRREQGRAGVWILHDGRVQWRFVTIGRSVGPLVEVASGLDLGEVVVDPADRYVFQLVTPLFDHP